MNRKWLGGWCSALVLALVACGSDGSSSPQREDSSSSGGLSSSGAALSSSSVDDSTDSTRAATGADLLPIMDLGDELGHTVRYVVSTHGIFSKVYLKNGEQAGMLSGLYTLESDGTLRADSLRSAGIALGHAASNLTNASIYADLVQSPGRIFRVHKTTGVLYAGKSRSELQPVKPATLSNWSMALVSQATDVQGVQKFTSGDSIMEYSLYADGAYVRQGKWADTLWEAGYYAVHNQYLVTVPVAYQFNPQKDQLSKVGFYKVAKATGQWTELGSTQNQTYVKSALSASISSESLQKSWVRQATAPVQYWSLDLSAGQAKLHVENDVAKVLYHHNGLHRLFGDYLLLDFYTQGANCTGDKSIGVGPSGDKTCFTYVLGKATLSGNALTYQQNLLPTDWILNQ